MVLIKSYVYCVVLLTISLAVPTTPASLFDGIMPRFPSMDSIFNGIRNYFRAGTRANFVQIDNSTYVWRLQMNLTGYNISSLNATRQGQYFQLTGQKKRSFNKTTSVSIGELLPKSVNVEKMTVTIRKKMLIAEAPVEKSKVEIIPIKGKPLANTALQYTN
ncbi:uncharacterized protein LOC106872931 [Octopus bimaculoides]|uniref:SHSP domain-containing protein n=1 Tax=Octopus bimaculoides TaxID=37653 RepID=A0A0L8H4J0_OCTBM|nr:uncharacterized protein LOC106872931 [Octopus bimaculoides]|eukprot:XP_014775593.1 PREDICTED: uncharacterized protein LOC106872931 [Octopus bimaculoides]